MEDEFNKFTKLAGCWIIFLMAMIVFVIGGGAYVIWALLKHFGVL